MATPRSAPSKKATAKKAPAKKATAAKKVPPRATYHQRIERVQRFERCQQEGHRQRRRRLQHHPEPYDPQGAGQGVHHREEGGEPPPEKIPVTVREPARPRRTAPLASEDRMVADLTDPTVEMALDDLASHADEQQPSAGPAPASTDLAPLLPCRGVDMAYGPVQILFGVDFDVRQGEIVALLGTNGAGKSTLLKAHLRSGRADGGHRRLQGRGRHDLDRRRHDPPRHLADARRQGRVPHPHGRREPAPGVVAHPQGRRPRRGGQGRGARRCSRSSRSASTRWPATSPAASSRCSRSARR